ncbi:MAG: hypothetical protein JOZ31_03385 [Verrucomicrobia bacterium]|nr:hypothetical protein [Verrucomicrobiota bacterium]MBV8484354.1 hypothetical protein [Verrucomicrobiota bacterium]
MPALRNAIKLLCQQAIEANPKSAEDYRAGKGAVIAERRLQSQTAIPFTLLKLGRGDPFVSKCRPRHPAELQIEDRLSV